LACLIFILGGSAFAKNDNGNNGNGKGNGGNKGSGQTYAAPEFNFSGPLKYELLVFAGGGVLLLARRPRCAARSAVFDLEAKKGNREA